MYNYVEILYVTVCPGSSYPFFIGHSVEHSKYVVNPSSTNPTTVCPGSSDPT